MGTMANSEDPDEMPHKVKQSSRAEIHQFTDILTGNPLKCKVENAILTVSV